MKYLKSILIALIPAILIAGFVYADQTGSKVFPFQGGTGRDTSDWTGNVRIDNGTWATTTAGGDLNAIWSTSSTAIYPTDLGLNVGIGTTTPNAKLTVVGNISGTGTLDIDGISTLQILIAPIGLITNLTATNTSISTLLSVTGNSVLATTSMTEGMVTNMAVTNELSAGATTTLATTTITQLTANEICISGDTCETSWPAGGGGAFTSGNGSTTLNEITDSVGMGTGGPDRQLDILDATNPQLRLTHTDGSVYVDMQAKSGGGMLVVSGSGDLMHVDVSKASSFLGKNAGLNNTGVQNTAIGDSALDAGNAGFFNTAIGYRALGSQTSGNSNTAIGHGALAANVSGGQNTAIGFQALTESTGSRNTGVGVQALSKTTTGADNFGLGLNVLQSNTTGNFNFGAGNNALQYLISGNNNFALGTNALWHAQDQSDYNFGAGRAADFFYPFSDTLVSLTETPQVGGSMAEGRYRYKMTAVLNGKETVINIFGNEANVTAGNSALLLEGIPTYNGTLSLTSRKLYRSKGQASQIGSVVYLLATLTDNSTTTYTDTTANASLGAEYDNPDFSMMLGAFAKAIGSNEFVVGSETAPITEMFIGEGIISTTTQDFTMNTTGGSGINSAGSNMIFAGGIGSGTGTGGYIAFKTANASTTSGVKQNPLGEIMRITSDGFIGIGTTTPTTTLTVYGKVSMTNGDYASCTALETDVNGEIRCGTDDTGSGLFDLIGTTVSPTSTSYKLGVGTTTAYYNLDVVGTLRATTLYGNGSNLTGITATAELYNATSSQFDVTSTLHVLDELVVDGQSTLATTSATLLTTENFTNNNGTSTLFDVNTTLHSLGTLIVDGLSTFANLTAVNATTTELAVSTEIHTLGTLIADGLATLSTMVVTTATTTQMCLAGDDCILTWGEAGNTLTFVSPLSRSVNAISISTSTVSVNGFLTNDDWTTFNNKASLTDISSTATGLTYTSGTGVISLTAGYVIPLTASTTDWTSAYDWGDHSVAGYLDGSTWTDNNDYPADCDNSVMIGIGDTNTCLATSTWNTTELYNATSSNFTATTSLQSQGTLTVSGATDLQSLTATDFIGVKRTATFNLGEWSATDTEVAQKGAEVDLTITNITCWGRNTTSTISMDIRATSSPHTAGTQIFTAEMACEPYQSTATTTFNDATLEGGSLMNIGIVGLEAQVASTTVVLIEYTTN